jgi:hypothetical protein
MAISKEKKKLEICPNPPKILAILKNNSSKCGQFSGNFPESSINHVACDSFFF